MKPHGICGGAVRRGRHGHAAEADRLQDKLVDQHQPRKLLRVPKGCEGDDVHAHTMRQLRVCIGVLSAILLASAAHAVVDGVTAGRALALALTVGLFLAALGLRRMGTRNEPDDASTGRHAARGKRRTAAAPGRRRRRA